MRELTGVAQGMVNVLILVGCFIGFSLIPIAVFHDEKAIAAGSTVGGIAGLIIAIGVIIAINHLRERSRNKETG